MSVTPEQHQESFARCREIERRAIAIFRPFLDAVFDGHIRPTEEMPNAKILQCTVGDFLAYHVPAEEMGVELKAEMNCPTGRLYLEDWSNYLLTRGWMHTASYDWIMYIFLDEKDAYIIRFKDLQEWAHVTPNRSGKNGGKGRMFDYDLTDQKQHPQFNDGRGYLVPISAIEKEVGFIKVQKYKAGFFVHPVRRTCTEAFKAFLPVDRVPIVPADGYFFELPKRKKEEVMAKPNVATVQESVGKLRNFLETATVREQIGKALPAHLTVDRMLRQCMTLVQSNTKLLECSQISILAGIIKASELGLELNGVLGQSYLVPRWNDKQKVLEATFQVGWRGFTNLAHRTGKVASLNMRVVHEHDVFSIEYGTQQRIVHKPQLTGQRGEATGYYACVVLVNGGVDFEFLTHAEAEAWRDRYAASDHTSSPWQTNFPQMAMKTCMRTLAKRLPLSVEFVEAAVTDEYGEAGVLPSQQVGVDTRTPRSDHVLEQLQGQMPVDNPSVAEPPEPGSMG